MKRLYGHATLLGAVGAKVNAVDSDLAFYVSIMLFLESYTQITKRICPAASVVYDLRQAKLHCQVRRANELRD